MRITGRLLPALVALLPLFAPVPLRAQQAVRIGIVDLDQAKNRSQTIQKSLKSVDDAIQPKQAEMQKMIAEHRRLREDLAARRSVLAEPEIKKQEASIDGVRDKIEALQSEIDRYLRRSSTEVVEPAVDRILKTVERVGKAKGFDLILRSDVVLFGAESLDITALVIQELDRAGADKGSPTLPGPEKAPAKEKAKKP